MEKRLLHPHLRNKIHEDRICVLPMGCNWHEIYLWLLPNEIRPYHGRTFTTMPSGIAEVQNSSIGGHFPQSTFALWNVRINNCIFFLNFSLIILIFPHPTPIGNRHEVLALARESIRQSAYASDVVLTHATVNRFLWRHAATGTLVPGLSKRGSSEDYTSSSPY